MIRYLPFIWKGSEPLVPRGLARVVDPGLETDDRGNFLLTLDKISDTEFSRLIVVNGPTEVQPEAKSVCTMDSPVVVATHGVPEMGQPYGPRATDALAEKGRQGFTCIAPIPGGIEMGLLMRDPVMHVVGKMKNGISALSAVDTMEVRKGLSSTVEGEIEDVTLLWAGEVTDEEWVIASFLDRWRLTGAGCDNP